MNSEVIQQIFFYEVEGDFVTFDVAIGNPSDPSLLRNLRDIRNRPQISEDDEKSFQTDFNYVLENADIFSSVDFGLRYAERSKSFRTFDGRADRDFIRNLGLTLDDFAAVRDFDVSGSPAGYPTTIVGVNFGALQAVTVPNGFDAPERLAARYDVEEDTLGLYTQLNFETEKLAGNVGFRYISTDQSSTGFQNVTDINDVTSLLPVVFTTGYEDVLPSLTARYKVTDEFIVRLGAYKSLTRPELTDIQPARNFAAFNGGNGTSGNPDLQPFTADNYDVSLEWYFGENSLLSVAYFLKELDGLIERVVEEVQIPDPFTGDLLSINLSRPINGENATVEGIELSYQTPFTFVSEDLEDFGLLLNFTTTDSRANFGSGNDIRNDQLPFISDYSYNAIFYYDDGTLSVRTAYNYRDDYLLAVSGSGGQPVFRDDYGQLDLSASYKMTDSLSLKFDVINALSDQIRSYSNSDPAQVKGLIETGRQISFGVSYKL